MEAKIVKIDKNKAIQILKHNTSNRPVTMMYVLQLKNIMETGKWKEGTGESIKIAKTGELLDGQHRLIALSMTSIEFNFLVVSDLDIEVFDVLDQGKKRTAGEVLSCFNVPNYNNIAAGIAKWVKLKNEDKSLDGIYQKRIGGLTPSDILSIYNENPDTFQDSHSMASKYYRAFGGLKISFYFAVYHFLKEYNKSEVEMFLHGLTTGEGLSLGDARLVLRNELMKYMGKKDRTMESIKLAYFIKSYNSYKSNTYVKVLQYTPGLHNFPKFK